MQLIFAPRGVTRLSIIPPLEVDMGMHKIEIVMTGGHGCDRKAKEGEALAPKCENAACPDCRARDLVDAFKERGAFGYPGCGATFTHWPGDTNAVEDDLVAGTRKKGQF